MIKNCKENKIENNSILQKFELAIQTKDISLLKSILYKKGEFDIQDKKFNTQTRKIQGFINWFGPKLENTTIESIKLDQCLHCKIGNTVLLINNGTFPRTRVNSFERSKTGLMIEIKDDLITTIKFCYVFLKTENNH